MIADRPYGSLTSALSARSAQRRIPLQGTFELSHRCSLRCAHCYNNLPVGDRAAQKRELSRDEYRALFDEVAAFGCLYLLFTGGEVFARPDFMDVYADAKARGFLITIFTNATMITPAIADALAANAPVTIEVTLYGRTRETYERVTGVAGSFDRCMRGIALLRERGLPLKVKTVALSINAHELPAIRDYVEGELGGRLRFDAMMNPRIDGSQSPLEVRLTPEEVVALDAADPRRLDDWRTFAEKSRTVEPDPAQLYHCGGGVTTFTVDPYGGMSLCLLSQQDKYDLRGGSFAAGWEHFLRGVRAKPTTRPSKCGSCRLKGICSKCPATAELHSGGDPEAAVPFYCETAHLRAMVIGVEITPHGPCEFCPGGAEHERLIESAQRLTSADPPRPRARARSLPIVTSTGGCCSQ